MCSFLRAVLILSGLLTDMRHTKATEIQLFVNKTYCNVTYQESSISAIPNTYEFHCFGKICLFPLVITLVSVFQELATVLFVS